MTILATVASQSYSPQALTVAFTPANVAGATQVRITLTRPEWPSGDCVTYEVLWDSISSGICTIGGGVRADKGGGNIPSANLQDTSWTCDIPPGFSSATARITVLQTLTTSLLVEGL